MGLFGSILGAVGGLIGGNSASKASNKAATLQYDASMKGIEETQRQFDLTRSDFAPILEAGTGAIGEIGNILGLNGDPAQATALDALKASPFYQSLFRTGEEAVLQNASATGGLRGGNTKRGLADFGADTFASVIQNMLVNLGGLASLGTGAAGSVGTFGANAAANIGNLYGQGAQARAGDVLTRGGIASQNWQNIGSIGGEIDSAVKDSGGWGKVLGGIF